MSTNEGPFYERGNNGHYDINANGNHKSDHSLDNVDEHEEEHEHVFNNIIQTHNISAYAEAIHEVVTLEFHDRGLSLDLSYAEANELGKVLTEVVNFLARPKPV